jgi:hypothetical protein
MADISEDLSYLNGIEVEDTAGAEQETVTEEQEVEELPEEQEQDTEEAAEEQGGEEDHTAKPGVEVEVKPKGRAETRIQKLANEAREAREAKIRAEAERDALLKFRPNTPAPDNSEAIRLRNEKLSLMEPTERVAYLQGEELSQIKQQLLLSDLRSEDRADKAAFDARAVVDPRYARNKEDVEKELRDLRTKGINATREQVLAQVIGRKLLSEKPRKAARTAAAARVDATKGKPIVGRGTQPAAAGKGDGLADLESRLRGKSFNEMFNN